MEPDYRNKRITVLGLGRHGGGVAAARFLAGRGASVTVSDMATADELAESIAALQSVPIANWDLAGHNSHSFSDAEMLVVNPAVRPGNEFVATARRRGAVIASEIELFLRQCPAPIIGVTGSNGKSTTAAMIAAAVEASGRKTWLGGNIERSLLPQLNRIAPDHFVVLELSSFQLFWLSPNAPRPEFVVLTSLSPNHLDWHGDAAHYVAAKRRIFAPANAGQTVVADGRDFETAALIPSHADGTISPVSDRELPKLKVAGRHNRRNAALAVAAACAVGVLKKIALDAVHMFAGLPHRLQHIGTFRGRQCVNDSQATTPEAAIAALEAFPDRRCFLLAGGADKGADFTQLGKTIARRAVAAAVFGTTAGKIADAVRQADATFPVVQLASLADALAWIWGRSVAGDVILLSPACSSRDQFADYAARADEFRSLLSRITAPTSHPVAGA